MFTNYKKLSELRGTIDALKSERDSLKRSVEEYSVDAIRYRQLKRYTSYDLTSPEGLLLFRDSLLAEQLKLNVDKATLNITFQLKDKDIENLKEKIKDRDDRVEFLKSLLKKG